MKRAAFLLLMCSLASAGCGTQATSRAAPPPASGTPAERQPAALQLLDRTCRGLAEQLAAKLPKGRTTAVLPLTDPDGGVRRLGFLLAEGIERNLLAGAAGPENGIKIIDRAHLDKIIREVDLAQVIGGSQDALDKTGAVADAEVLIVGSTHPAGSEVLVSAKAVDLKGNVLAATEQADLPAGDLGQLMWIVRRPGTGEAHGDLPPLAVRCEFFSPAAGGDVTALGDGSTVRSGQKFKLRVQANSDCHLYVLLYDSGGQASVLFPHQKIGLSNQARGGVDYEVPEGAKYYWFDNRPGTETFYLVASYTPLADLDRILAEMQQAAGRQGELATRAEKEINTVIIRGMNPDTSADYRPKGFNVTNRGVYVDVGWGTGRAADTQSVDNVVTGHATVVKKVTMRHQ